MTEPVPAVEPTVPPAATEPAVTPPPAAPAADDLTAKLREAESKLAKTQEERDNYRQGMLNAKERLKKAGIDEEPEQIDVAAIVDQRLAAEVAPIKAEVERLRHEIAERDRAANAHAGATTGGATAGQKITEPDVPELTPAEEALLKRRGLSAKDVPKN